jgi:hypothetical protein
VTMPIVASAHTAMSRLSHTTRAPWPIRGAAAAERAR